MAYAAYRDDHAFIARSPVIATQIHVLGVVVSCADAWRVRRAVAHCPGAGVLRCEVLLNERSSAENDAPRARLMIRLALSSYAQVVHALLAFAALLVPLGIQWFLLTHATRRQRRRARRRGHDELACRSGQTDHP